jgi:hypothetical protein
MPIRVIARSKAWVWGCSPTEIVGSNPAGAWMSVYCKGCVLSCRGFCDELITRPEESYRLWCVVVCALETLRMRPLPALGHGAQKKKSCLANSSLLWCYAVWYGIYMYQSIRHEGPKVLERPWPVLGEPPPKIVIFCKIWKEIRSGFFWNFVWRRTVVGYWLLGQGRQWQLRFVFILWRYFNATCFGSSVKIASFLGAFAKLRKATIGFVLSALLYICLSVCPSCLSVRPHGTTRLPQDQFP